MIVIVDYGLGNLRSVAGAIIKVGYQPLISGKKEDIKKATKLILPGVGAFGDGMKNLKKLGLVELLTDLVVHQGKPIFAICLGFQLLSKESFEFGHHEGLGWINASTIRIKTNENLPVPHVGWNDLIQTASSPLYEGIPPEALFYYVHSYHVQCHTPNIIIGEGFYGIKFTAAIQQHNIYGTQFHPEKSQLHGLTLLKNFLEKG